MIHPKCLSFFFLFVGFSLAAVSVVLHVVAEGAKVFVRRFARKKNCRNFRSNFMKFAEIITAKKIRDAADSIYPTSEM